METANKRKKKRYPTWIKRRLKAFRERQIAVDPHCWYCGLEVGIDNSTVDHVEPACFTGNHDEENLRLTCIECNSKKANHPLRYLACRPQRGEGLVTIWELESSAGQPDQRRRRRFSYRRLRYPRREILRANAVTIHRLRREKTGVAVEIGRRFDAALLLIGDWTDFASWLNLEFCWNQQTADTYFRIAAEFGDAQCLGQFTRQALRILSLPDTDQRAREAALEAARQGDEIDRSKALRYAARFADEPTPAKANSLNEFQETIDWLLDHAESLRDWLTDTELVNFSEQLNRLAATVQH